MPLFIISCLKYFQLSWYPKYFQTVTTLAAWVTTTARPSAPAQEQSSAAVTPSCWRYRRWENGIMWFLWLIDFYEIDIERNSWCQRFWCCESSSQMPSAVSLWHNGACNRFFQCMEANYQYAIIITPCGVLLWHRPWHQHSKAQHIISRISTLDIFIFSKILMFSISRESRPRPPSCTWTWTRSAPSTRGDSNTSSLSPDCE